MNDKKWYLLMLVSFVPIWYLVKFVSQYPDFLLPSPNLVIQVLWDERSDFLLHTGVTMGEALIGYALANIIAIVMAVSFLYLPWFESFATPWTVVVKNVPFVTIASILVITLGDSIWPRIIIVILICFFPILANLTKGLRSVDTVLLDRMKTLNASRWQIFVKVRWASALPYYIAAHEISFTGSIIGAVIAEWLFSRQGLGFLIIRSMQQYRADKLYAVSLIASALAVGAYVLVRVIEAYLFRWQRVIKP